MPEADRTTKTKTGRGRLITRIAVTGAIVAVPLTVAAAPAMADPAPGVVQADRGWNHDHNWNPEQWWHQHEQAPVVPPLPWVPGPAVAPNVVLPNGLFGSS